MTKLLVDEYNPFEEQMFQIIDQNGKVTNKEREPKLDEKLLLDFYYYMRLSRVVDEKGLKMQRAGRMGTFAPASGQEAAQVGSALAITKDDWMVPSFREPAAMLTRGAPVRNNYIYFMGDERANQVHAGVKNLPISIPVGSQVVLATGVAWASKLQKKKDVTLVFFGDGATSEGAFHEGMNFGGVFKLPIVYLCQNNQFAISISRKHQTASKTLAQKAYAYGFKGIQVDGNDVLAMYLATKEAADQARAGNGPTMIEAVTYRQGLHTTADDPTKYRDPKEHEEWLKRDPIIRFKKYLVNKKILTPAKEKEFEEKIQTLVAAEVKAAEEYGEPEMEDMFTHIYAEIPQHLQEQLEYLKDAEANKEVTDKQEKIEGGFP